MRRHATNPAAGFQALGALLRDFDQVASVGYWELPAGRLPVIQGNGIPELGFERSRREPEWSASLRVAGRHAEVDLPTFNIGGWFDIPCQGTLDNFVAMQQAGRPAILVMGLWVHTSQVGQVGDVNFGIAASGDVVGMRGRIIDLQLDWFEQWLSSTSTAEPAKPPLPPVRLFVMGANEWRAEQEWPLSRAVDTELYLRAGGRLTRDRPEADEGSGTYI